MQKLQLQYNITPLSQIAKSHLVYLQCVFMNEIYDPLLQLLEKCQHDWQDTVAVVTLFQIPILWFVSRKNSLLSEWTFKNDVLVCGKGSELIITASCSFMGATVPPWKKGQFSFLLKVTEFGNFSSLYHRRPSRLVRHLWLCWCVGNRVIQPPEITFLPICVWFLRWAQNFELVNIAQAFFCNILLAVNFSNVSRVGTNFDSFQHHRKSNWIRKLYCWTDDW